MQVKVLSKKSDDDEAPMQIRIENSKTVYERFSVKKPSNKNSLNQSVSTSGVIDVVDTSSVVDAGDQCKPDKVCTQEVPTVPPPKKMRLKYYADMNSATFFAMTFEYKWKYKYSDQDLSDLFKECSMLLMLQLLLSLLILVYG